MSLRRAVTAVVASCVAPEGSQAPSSRAAWLAWLAPRRRALGALAASDAMPTADDSQSPPPTLGASFLLACELCELEHGNEAFSANRGGMPPLG